MPNAPCGPPFRCRPPCVRWAPPSWATAMKHSPSASDSTAELPWSPRPTGRGDEGAETRMIGREAELKPLQHAYLDAFEDGETRVVTVTGEAGVGKSRLLYEFAEWGELRPERYFIFRGRATPESRNRPYGLFRDTLTFRLRP